MRTVGVDADTAGMGVVVDVAAQVRPSFDDEHFATWERGRGSTTGSLSDGSKVTIFFRKPELRQEGALPRGGIARFYGIAEIHRAGPIYDQIWERLIQPEKNNDPEKQGFGVLIKVERAEDLRGAPLQLD